MPLKVGPMTQKEIAIAREEAEPTVSKILNLLLRGGAHGFLEFQQEVVRVCESDQVSSSGGHRLNIEALKKVFSACGVLLSPDEYRAVMLGYSDAVGFLLVDALLSAICPVAHLTPRAERDLLAVFPAPPTDGGSGAGEGEGQGALEMADVPLNGVLELIAYLFAPTGDAADDGSNAAQSATNGHLQAAYEEAAEDFTLEAFPTARVPGLAAANYVAALLLLHRGDASFTSAVSERLRNADGRPALEALPPLPASGAARKAAVAAATAAAAAPGAARTYTMTHTGVRSERRFERYRDQDRRDEWLRRNDEPESRPAYLKHTVGYGGHLPEYQYHFGRTFHVIEEDLPQLVKPPKQLEPVAPDAFGRGRETRSGIMNEHHFKFA